MSETVALSNKRDKRYKFSMEKLFSEACERNKDPILNVLREVILPTDERLLEVGAGTGQHAEYFSSQFPRLEWYPTDKNIIHLKDLQGSRMLQKAQRLDVAKDDFPKLRFDVVFTANTFHIMSWKECKSFIKLLGHRLREGSRVVIYGPFKYKGVFTSQSNEEFDASLKARDPQSGIRAFEDVHTNMEKQGFELVDDHEMPANNRCLVYVRLKFIPHAR